MTTIREPLRIVFLGCGHAARMHSRVLRRIGGVALYYASRDRARASAFRRELSGQRSFCGYEEAVSADIDVVVVTTPTVLHRELALMALHAGKHVIVEKPAFMRAADADHVRSVAYEVGRRVLVAENYAYKPITIALARLVQDGDLGDVRFVTINATKRQAVEGWRGDAALAGGGALFEGGVHWVSFAASLGLEVRSAHGYPAGSPHSALVVFNYANGAVGSLTYSWELQAPFGGLRLSKIQGTLGAATFESNGFVLVVSGRSPSIRFPGIRDPLGYRAMWSDFLHALRADATPRFTLAMARRDLQLLEDAGASSADELHLLSSSP